MLALFPTRQTACGSLQLEFQRLSSEPAEVESGIKKWGDDHTTRMDLHTFQPLQQRDPLL